MRRSVLLCLCFLCCSLTLGAAQNDINQMRSNVEEGYYAVAVRLGPNLIANYPENAEAHYLYSLALYLTGQNLPLARDTLDKALTLAPDTPEYTRLDGLIKAREGDTVGALGALEAAFSGSQRYEVAMDWGRVAWESGNFEEALRAYEAASATERGRAELWPYLNSGRILKSQGDLNAARSVLERAVEVYNAGEPEGVPSPGYVEAYFRLGEVYEAAGQFEEARTHYQSAANLDVNYGPARDALDRLRRRGFP